MSPVAGQRLGPYEIISPLGAGGMGEVWRARDTRLDRSVAIKMLPADLAANVQLRARFEREARSISQLSHPNICSLFDVGDDYLVMELLDGESLADRLTRGPLPIEQALRIGIDVASALQCAHRSGIVHRDLKPGNVMLTKSGTKLLDFGLAKASTESSPGAMTTSATQQLPLTEEGTIVGTYYYMSPEQLTGGSVDARSDIFALGSLLYEMVAGRRPFEGKTKTSVIASILDRDPTPLSEINHAAPPPLGRVVALCLAKDPDDRWQSAHDVGLELSALRDGSGVLAMTAAHPRRRLLRALGSAAAIVIAVIAGFLAARRVTPARTPVHLALIPPVGRTIAEFVLSPRGGLAAVIASDTEHFQSLWVQDLVTGKTRPVENTNGARQPFFSPDGTWIGFQRDSSLYKVLANNGSPVLVRADLGFMAGGSWGPDNTILVALDDQRGVNRVSAFGGPLTRVSTVDARNRETRHMWPSFLPDGKHFLYLADADAGEDHFICVGSLDGKEAPKRLFAAVSNAIYAGGSLIYGKTRTLLSQPFDLKRMEVTGEPHIISDMLADTDFHHYVFSADAFGAIGFSTFDPRSRLHLVDRGGKELGVFGEPADWVSVSWSPDGRHALMERVDVEPRDAKLWLADLTLRTFGDFSGVPSLGGFWSPDSTQVLYQAVQPGGGLVSAIRGVDGSGMRKLPTVPTGGFVSSWIGDWVAMEVSSQSNPADVEVVSISSGKRIPVATTPAWENDAAISPDGRWIAYAADGRIIIQPLPPTGAEITLSSVLGVHPLWRADGKEIYFVTEKGIMAVPIEAGGTSIQPGTPTLLVGVMLKPFKNRAPYAVAPDGQRFLLNVQDSYERPAHVILDWAPVFR